MRRLVHLLLITAASEMSADLRLVNAPARRKICQSSRIGGPITCFGLRSDGTVIMLRSAL